MVKFIRDEVHGAGFEKAVLGLSGGVDSSLSAYLTAEALGHGNVHGMNMPYKDSSVEGIRHGSQSAKDPLYFHRDHAHDRCLFRVVSRCGSGQERE